MENTQQSQVPAQGTSQSSGSGKKTLWIVLGMVLLLLIIGGFMIKKIISTIGNKVFETAIERGTGDDADVNLGNGEVTVKTEGGSVTYGNAKLPDDWPSDVPVYPGAQISFAGSSTGNTDNKAAAAVNLTTSDMSEKVVRYYNNEISARGWKITGTQSTTETTIIVAEKDTRAVGIQITSDGTAGTMITVTVGTK